MKILKITILMLTLYNNLALSDPLCALAPHVHSIALDQQPSPAALQQMASVNNYLCSKFGCPQYQFFQNNSLGNAMASVNQLGYQIRYNSNFMNSVHHNFGSFATIGIFAHELGHIIDFAQNPSQIPQAQREATADLYAGCVFALAGYPISASQALAASLHALGPSPGYPTPSQRVQLVQQGYNMCL